MVEIYTARVFGPSLAEVEREARMEATEALGTNSLEIALVYVEVTFKTRQNDSEVAVAEQLPGAGLCRVPTSV